MEEFRHELQDTLTHLHDPDFQPSPQIYALLGCDEKAGAAAVQLALTHLIQQPHPAGEVAGGLNATERQLLQQRFVLKLTQEESAARLHMSVRTLQRVQRRAVYLLARALWEQRSAAAGEEPHAAPLPELLEEEITEATNEETPDWQQQVKAELDSLRQLAPNAASDLGLSLERVLAVGQAVAGKRGVVVEAAVRPSNVLAAIHPSALRHVLLTAIEQMAQRLAGGKITLAATSQTNSGQANTGASNTVEITIEGAPLATGLTLATGPALTTGPGATHELMRALVTSHGGSVSEQVSGATLRIHIRLPSSGNKVTIMVIDDNADLVAFYRRYVAGSRYEIVHLPTGNALFAAIAETHPALIILDVLLPDADGWELLTYLHEHPATRAIPIVVASVVRGEELALALGAAAYLPKPVRRQPFMQLLDQLLAGDRASL